MKFYINQNSVLNENLNKILTFTDHALQLMWCPADCALHTAKQLTTELKCDQQLSCMGDSLFPCDKG
jgi:hypothetical protein